MSQEIPESKKDKYDVSQISDNMATNLTFLPDSFNEWYTQRGYKGMSVNLFNQWECGDKRTEYTRKIIEAIEEIGPKNLKGKSLNFSPNSMNIGEDTSWDKKTKIFMFGLDLPVESIIEGIRKNILVEPAKKNRAHNRKI